MLGYSLSKFYQEDNTIKSYPLPLLFGGAVLIGVSCTQTDQREIREVLHEIGKQVPPSTRDSVSAVKKALHTGVRSGINQLSAKSGFLHSAYKIPIPNELQAVVEVADTLGFDRYVKDFEVSINSAAGQAVTAATPLFREAISELSFADVEKILRGPENAATLYFREKSLEQLKIAFKPIVQKATDKADVTRYYNKIYTVVRPVAALNSLRLPELNLDNYITQRAVEALFEEVARQEKNIRENPMAATSGIIKRVFTYYSGV